MSERKPLLITDDTRMGWADAVTTAVDREILAQCSGTMTAAQAVAMVEERMAEEVDVTALGRPQRREMMESGDPEPRIPRGLTPEQLRELQRQGGITSREFQSLAGRLMTGNLALVIRALRCEQGYTWRAVAQHVGVLVGGSWGDNQLMGMALCEAAARGAGEDYMREPWN